nr:MAG TPA: hypothetical protein [Caudoviricetes sp.]
MNLLIDGLPETVEICGRFYPINADFRAGILFEEAIQDPVLSGEEKLITTLKLYYPEVAISADMLEDALAQALWFYRCGTDQAESAGSRRGESQEPQKKSFSYEYDADYIYAAFMSAYGIDLATSNLHWWQFRALFRALPEDTQIVKIIGYRTMEIPKKATKEQKAHYRRMKRIYALPEDPGQKQAESDLTEILMNGGNPSALLNQGDSKQWQTEH